MSLYQLTPKQVACSVADWTTEQATRLAGALSFGGVATDPVVASESCEAARVASCLTHYAQTGIPPEGRQELVGEYLQSMAEILWTAVHPDVYASTGYPWDKGDVPGAAIDVVLCAAWCRYLLARGESVRPTQLAALAGVSTGQIRNELGPLRATLELDPDSHRARRTITAESAVEWLRNRETPGFALT